MTREYGSNIVPGAFVEISPHFELWMRGARFGEVVKVVKDVAHVKMVNPHVKEIFKCKCEDLIRR